MWFQWNGRSDNLWSNNLLDTTERLCSVVSQRSWVQNSQIETGRKSTSNDSHTRAHLKKESLKIIELPWNQCEWVWSFKFTSSQSAHTTMPYRCCIHGENITHYWTFPYNQVLQANLVLFTSFTECSSHQRLALLQYVEPASTEWITKPIDNEKSLYYFI